ncbi:MAG: hypothetical protein ISS17_04445 [Bacteroidales bacterium]|nr:hypothetical protein [Bacteroidales bacterium]
MKTLSIINLHKAEIRKNQLAKIKGGIEVKCFCSINNPYVAIKQQGGTTKFCNCESATANTAGVYSSTPD